MTVEVVTINGHLQSVHATAASADASMLDYRTRRSREAWRQISPRSWASNDTTSLMRREMLVMVLPLPEVIDDGC